MARAPSSWALRHLRARNGSARWGGSLRVGAHAAAARGQSADAGVGVPERQRAAGLQRAPARDQRCATVRASLVKQLARAAMDAQESAVAEGSMERYGHFGNGLVRREAQADFDRDVCCSTIG